MSRATTAIALLGAGALVLGVSACSSPADGSTDTDSAATSGEGFAVDAETLVFGVVPDSVDTETNYQPLMDYIAQETGLEVQYFESTDYAALIEAAVAGQVDVASFSGFTYVTATNNGAELTPISSIVTAEGQEPGYFSQAIVANDSDIESLEDFAGSTVCFVDPSSTSGYLFPSYNLLEVGIDPETGVTPVFAGKHDVVVQEVANGNCDAGFAEDSEVEVSEDVRVVDETMVPGAPIVMSTTLPEEMQTQLSDLLAEVTVDQIIESGVESAESEGFQSVFFQTVPVDDEYYDLIRDICTEINASQCEA